MRKCNEKENNRIIINNINEYRFEKAYETISSNKLLVLCDYLRSEVKHVSNDKKLLFLLYVASRNPEITVIVSLCEYLFYYPPFIEGNHQIIKVFVLYALKAHPNSIDLLSWVVDTYSGNPDSPFQDSELEVFKKLINYRTIEKPNGG